MLFVLEVHKMLQDNWLPVAEAYDTDYTINYITR